MWLPRCFQLLLLLMCKELVCRLVVQFELQKVRGAERGDGHYAAAERDRQRRWRWTVTPAQGRSLRWGFGVAVGFRLYSRPLPMKINGPERNGAENPPNRLLGSVFQGVIQTRPRPCCKQTLNTCNKRIAHATFAIFLSLFLYYPPLLLLMTFEQKPKSPKLFGQEAVCP